MPIAGRYYHKTDEPNGQNTIVHTFVVCAVKNILCSNVYLKSKFEIIFRIQV